MARCRRSSPPWKTPSRMATSSSAARACSDSRSQVMNLSHFLAVLRARWLAAVIVFAVVLTAAILYLIFATRGYTATASILIDAKPDPVSSMLYGGPTPSQINTQIDIIHSDRVAQRVVQNLKLADLADMRSEWASAKSGQTIQEWLTELIENGL